MADFDFDAYVKSRSASDQKLQGLIDASKVKAVDLVASSLAKQAELHPKTSWADKLGLDSGGLAAETVNLGASFVSGASRLAGQVASLPVTMYGAAATHDATPQDYEAFNRYQTGKATAEDMALLSRQPLGSKSTILEGFQTAGDMRDLARGINDTADLTKIVNQDNRNDLNASIGEGFDENWKKVQEGGLTNVATGLAKIFYQGGKALLTHPSAVAEYAVENAPQLFIGAFGAVGKAGMAASNIGYAADVYQQGLENYSKANGGQLPPEELRQKWALQAASLAIAEHAGDHAALAFGKLGKAAEGLPAVGLGKGILNTAKAAGEGFTTEALTEGYQESAEGDIKGQPASAKQIFTAGMIGGASGAALSGGAHGLAEATQSTEAHQEIRQADAKATDDLRAGFKAAAQNGDVSGYTDATKSTYNPDIAVQALHAFTLKPGVDDATKQQKFEEASKIVSDLEEKHKIAQMDLKDVSPEGITALQSQISTLESKAQAEKDPAKVEDINGQIDDLKLDLKDAVDGSKDTKKVAAYAKTAAELEKKLTTAQANLEEFSRTVNSSTDVDTEVNNVAKATTPQEVQSSVNRVMAMALMDPETLDASTAQSLIDHEHTTPAQKEFLKRFTETEAAGNKLRGPDGVENEVMVGDASRKMLGIADYRRRMATALSSNNQAKADKNLELLRNFSADHSQKATLAQKALDMVNSGQYSAVQVQSIGNGSWKIETDSKNFIKSKKDRALNGSLELHRGSGPKGAAMVERIGKEAAALNSAEAELQAAYDARFSQPTEAVNVPNASQPQAGTQEQAQGTGQLEPQATVPQQDPAGVRPEGQPAAAAEAGPVSGAVQEEPASPSPVQAQAETRSERTADPTGTSEAKATSQAEGEAGVAAATAEAKTADTVAEKNNESRTNPSEKKVQSTPSISSEKLDDDEARLNSSTNVEDFRTPSPDPEEETTSEESTTEPGTLSAYAEENAPEDGYTKKNLVKAGLIQKAQRKGDKTLRPLVAVKNFISNLVHKKVDLTEFLDLKELDDKQKEAIHTFIDKMEAWNESIWENLREKDLAHRTKNFITYLVKPDVLDLDENTKAAMVYGIFNWTLEKGATNAFNTDEDINAMLGQDEAAELDEGIYELLRFAGNYQTYLVNDLGKLAVQALGLSATKNAEKDTLPKLQLALGSHMVKLMADKGIIERTNITGAQIIAAGGDPNFFKAGAIYTFAKLARDENGKIAAEPRSIIEAQRKTGNVLDKLFKSDPGLKPPSFEPVKITQQTTKNTDMRVPRNEKNIVQKDNNTPFKLRTNAWNVLSKFDDKLFALLAGAQDITANTHFDNAVAYEAKNNGLKQEIQNIRDFVESMPDKTADLFFEHIIWKQQRVGIATNMINPQTSKVHRHLLARQAWESMVESSSEKDMENFKLRVGESLGIKTDQNQKQAALDAYEAKLALPEIQAAVEAIKKSLTGAELTTEEQQTIVAGVQKGGEDMHSFDGLLALAEMGLAQDKAKADGKKNFTFKTQLIGEVDGVANGPMLSHLLFGAARSVNGFFELLNKGGFYQLGSKHTQYNNWRGSGEGNLDLYESTMKSIITSIADLVNAKDKEDRIDPKTVQAVDFFMNFLSDDVKSKKNGRNAVKKPITSMIFGSSTDKSVDGMANEFVNSVRSKIEGLAENWTKEDHWAFVDAYNQMMRAGNGQEIKDTISVDTLLETLHKSQVLALKKGFKKSIGKAVKGTLERDFAPFLARREAFNDTAQLTFEIFNAAYTSIRNDFVQELIKDKKIEVNPESGVPLHDMTAEQEAELKDRLKAMTPVMNTLFSKESGQLDAGLEVAKSEARMNRNPAYEAQAQFAKPFVKGGTSNIRSRAVTITPKTPGVSLAPISTHATDSYISHVAAWMSDMQVLNIHDAHGTGLAGFHSTAQNLNKATWEAMLKYSPATEMRYAMGRTLIGLADAIKAGTLPAGTLENLATAMTKFTNDKYHKETYEGFTPAALISSVMHRMADTAYQADKMKLEALTQMAFIDQYALEGGNYAVTDEDRAEAAKRLADLKEGLEKEETAALDTVVAALTDIAPASSRAAPAQASQSVSSPPVFGKVGTPDKAIQYGLKEFFAGKTEVKARALIQHLYTQMGKEKGPMTEYYRTLLKELAQSVTAELTINYITPETDASKLKAEQPANARGWYGVGTNEINVLGADFVRTGLTAEVLLHEMLHSVLVDRMSKPTKEMQLHINKLTDLMTRAQAKADPKFAPAFVDVDEFIAYGMTNPEFQDFLKTVPATTNLLEKLVNALQEFVQELAQALGFKNAKSAQALGVLMTNTAALMNLADGVPAVQAGPVKASTGFDAEKYSTEQVFDALGGNVSPGFRSQLRGLLGGIVNKLYGPYGSIAEAMRKTEAGNPLAVWLKALEMGKAPFASRIVASPLAASAQEDFAMQQVEATVRVALSDSSLTKVAYRQLYDLYTEAKSTFKAADFYQGDWNAAGDVQAKAEAQAKYDFIFKIEQNADGKSDYLARFAALGLAHEEFNKLLQRQSKVSQKQLADAKTFAEKVQMIFERILNAFNQMVTHTYLGQPMNEKLEMLVNQLVDIEAKKRLSVIADMNKTDSFVDSMEAKAKVVSETVRNKVNKVAKSAFVKDNAFAIVRMAGTAANIATNNRFDKFMEGMGLLRDAEFKERPKTLSALMNYVKGPLDQFQTLLRATKEIEKRRKQVMDNAAQAVMQGFVNEGKDLTEAQKKAITQTIMRTGMHNLLDEFSMDEMHGLLTNQKDRTDAINAWEAKLSGQVKDDYIRQANILGFYKATGMHRGVLMMNAHVISKMADTPLRNLITEEEAAAAEPIIKVLATLYSLKYQKKQDLKNAAEVLAEENARNDNQNGVELTLLLHRQMEVESLNKVFGGNPMLMVHGFTPEITNPHIEIKIASAQEGAALEELSYVRAQEPLATDPSDPDQTAKYVYVLRDGGLAPYQSGAMSNRGMRAKGSAKHNGYLNIETETGQENAQINAQIMHSKMAQLSNIDPRADLNTVTLGSSLAPIYNAAGEIVNWRYMMNEQTKDVLLQRDNDFGRVLGMLAGSTYDKVSSREQNAKVVQALHDQYVADREDPQKKAAYIWIGPKTNNKEMREIWRLLPQETKDEVRQVWGAGGMYVRMDSLDIIFGYRKRSLTEAFKTDPETRSAVNQLFVAMMTAIFGKKAALRVAQGERMWQEVVHEAKDIIVVKSGVVLLGNIWSNITLLHLNGVPIKDMVKHHLVALKAATTYRNDITELDRLNLLLKTGYTQGKDQEIRDQIVRLEDSIARNPIKDLIDGGLMPTIVEDIKTDEDIYSYKSLFNRKVDGFTKEINPSVLNAAKGLYMAHDFKPYQALSHITQLSDFVARYTLYQHYTTRKTNPMSKAEAIQRASDSFINYDIPMPKNLQYLDDMGLIMFTKYFLSIQRVLAKLIRERPGAVLMQVALSHYLEAGNTVLSGSFWSHLGNNPIEIGAFKIFSAMRQLMSVSAPLSLLK